MENLQNLIARIKFTVVFYNQALLLLYLLASERVTRRAS